MRLRSIASLTGAILAALPFTSSGAIITYQFDVNDIKISPTKAGPYKSANAVSYASLSGTAAAPDLTVPDGTYIEYGVDAEVTNNNGLGMAAFQTGILNSTNSATSTAIVNVNPTIVDSFFGYMNVGVVDGNGGVSTVLGTYGETSSEDTIYTTKALYGANAFAELYSSQQIDPITSLPATFSLSLTNFTSAFLYITSGVNSSGTTDYFSKKFVPGVDTLNPLPTLTVNYVSAPVPEPASMMVALAGLSLLLSRSNRRLPLGNCCRPSQLKNRTKTFTDRPSI